MSYRGFTWNLTYTEYANIARLMLCIEQCDCASTHTWDRQIARGLRHKLVVVMEVTPDGPNASHGPADA
jgi:hypothetical protein